MPLSEHEQKMLQQMEQALYAEDPQFATKITNHGLRHGRRRLVLGAVAGIAGLALVVLSAVNQLIWLGAAGFALLVAGGAYAFAPQHSKPALGTVGKDGTVRRQAGGASRRGTKGQKGTAGFMQRLEERWEHRRRNDW